MEYESNHHELNHAETARGPLAEAETPEALAEALIPVLEPFGHVSVHGQHVVYQPWSTETVFEFIPRVTARGA
jgi:hypothetical protein